ncbi:MAG TPA: response regulator [Candidatus Binatia bacterium]
MGRHAPPCVLVVEDNPDARAAFEALLQQKGFGVVTAGDGQEALDVLRGGLRPRLILLDLMMPRKDGWQFREEQIADPSLADVPVVVLSGAGQLDRHSKRLDVKDYLEKPVDVERLLEVVSRYCVD